MGITYRKLKYRTRDVLSPDRTRHTFIKPKKKRRKKRKPIRSSRRSSFVAKRKRMEKLVNSGAYKKWRKAVLARDGFLCLVCGIRKKLEVHHIIRKWDFPELIFDEDNGMTLCGPSTDKSTCHGGVTGREYEAIPNLMAFMHYNQRRAVMRLLVKRNLA